MKTFFWRFFGFFLIVGAPALWAQSSFSQGEDLFMRNKPAEALKFLEATIEEDPAHVQAFLYLGITYLQLSRVDDAIETYKKILPRGGAESARIAFNLGNAYFTKGDYETARQYYSRAIEEDSSYSSAYLNRANAFVRSGELSDAVTDYQAYLSIEPATTKRDEVEKLIAFIQEEFAANERRRIQAEEAAKAAEEARLKAEEQARVQAEEARLRAEEAARAEAERRRRLLQEVTESLQSAAEDSKGLSAGTENIQDYDGEFELE